jgi:hypothetical protein
MSEEVTIRSRDYSFKIVEFLQQNWAWWILTSVERPYGLGSSIK